MKDNFLLGVIFSDHLVKCIFSWLSLRPMILLFCFDLFVQNILFYTIKTDLGIVYISQSVLKVHKLLLQKIYIDVYGSIAK